MSNTYLVDRDPCRGALQNLSHKRKVLEGGVIVIEIQEVHKDCGAAGGLQRGSATWKDKEEGGRDGKMGVREK